MPGEVTGLGERGKCLAALDGDELPRLSVLRALCAPPRVEDRHDGLGWQRLRAELTNGAKAPNGIQYLHRHACSLSSCGCSRTWRDQRLPMYVFHQCTRALPLAEWRGSAAAGVARLFDDGGRHRVDRRQEVGDRMPCVATVVAGEDLTGIGAHVDATGVDRVGAHAMAQNAQRD